jgi:hypothetical protein
MDAFEEWASRTIDASPPRAEYGWIRAEIRAAARAAWNAAMAEATKQGEGATDEHGRKDRG